MSQRALHEDAVNPTPEFEADGGYDAAFFKSQTLVQAYRGLIGAVADDCHHAAIAQALAPGDKGGQQRSSEAAALVSRLDINRVFEGVTVGRSGAIAPRIGIAARRTVEFRYQIGQANADCCAESLFDFP
jgi:hypothetical protein